MRCRAGPRVRAAGDIVRRSSRRQEAGDRRGQERQRWQFSNGADDRRRRHVRAPLADRERGRVRRTARTRRTIPKRKPSLVASAATCSGEFRRVIPAKVEPLDVKRFECVEVNALHLTESNLGRELAILSWPLELGRRLAIWAFRSRRERGDRRLRLLAGPESQVVRRYVNDHCHHNAESSHPEERTMMHSFPIRTMLRVFGVVGSAVLLEFGIVHG